MGKTFSWDKGPKVRRSLIVPVLEEQLNTSDISVSGERKCVPEDFREKAVGEI